MEGLWRSGVSGEVLRARARLLSQIRAFFDERQVLEVQTPCLMSKGATAPYLRQFQCRDAEDVEPVVGYLQTSPEYAMKRLLAEDVGSIYQIAKAFRGGEQGCHHNPEFTLLEWYRCGFDYHQLMDEVESLFKCVTACSGIERVSYRQLFIERFEIDPWSTSIDQLRNRGQALGIDLISSVEDETTWCQLILATIESTLGQDRPLFLYDFPPQQAMLAQVCMRDVAVAERFELYWRGVELANGFTELRAADEQRRRFEQEQQARVRLGLPDMQIDERLLAALAQGLPPCAGVALGLDRLLMLKLGLSSLAEVIPFAGSRA